MGKNYTVRITVEIVDQSGLHVGHGHMDVEDVPASNIGYKGFVALHGDFVRAYWLAKEEFNSRSRSPYLEAGRMARELAGDHAGIEDAMDEPLPFEDNCTLPGHDEHTHCEVHGQCIPHGTDCPICMDLEAKGSQEQEQEFDDDVRASLDLQPCQGEDIRSRMSGDPIAAHHPDCNCGRCVLGDVAWLRLYHPEDY